MFKRVCKSIIALFAFVMGIFIFDNYKIEASYEYCDKQIEGTPYYDCGKYIYTYYEDTDHSSKVYALNDASILYLGKKDNIELFLAKGFKYFNYSYDDRSTKNNNLWATITSKGKVIFDGKFKDSLFINETHSGYYKNELFSDIYTIRQYVNDGELYRTIVIYNVDEDKDISIDKLLYDGVTLDKNSINEVLENKEDLSIYFSSKYGIKTSNISINGTNLESKIEGNKIIVDSASINNSLIKGEVSNLKIILVDCLANKKEFNYEILLVNNDVLIKFSTTTSIRESTSRRIVITALAGKGKTINKDYCWYYWSTSPDDSLLYDDFLMNYSNSLYKGSYSEDKGVILRNTSGTYYLYALARDNDSWVVVRSEGYTLNETPYKVNYNLNDAILIVSLLIICVLPIAIYLFIRKKGY